MLQCFYLMTHWGPRPLLKLHTINYQTEVTVTNWPSNSISHFAGNIQCQLAPGAAHLLQLTLLKYIFGDQILLSRLIFSNTKYFSLQAATRTSDIRLASLTSPTWRRHFSDRNSSLLYPALYHFYTHLSELSFTCAIIFIVIKYLSFINFYKE